jgi:hypothetical protein
MAEEIEGPIGAHEDSAALSARGRPEIISDDRLFSSRNRLLVLLARHWAEVGWPLQRIRDSEKSKVLRASRIIQDGLQLFAIDSGCEVLDLLVMPSESELKVDQLRAADRELYNLQTSIQDMDKREAKCSESLREAERIGRSNLSQEEVEPLVNEIAKRRFALEHAQAGCASLRDRRTKLSRPLKDGQAHFARTQLINFCTESRYELSPLNTANALAGIPWIRWRRSLTRCRQFKVEGDPNAGPYGACTTLQAIVNSCPSHTSLVAHAEKWFRDRKRTESTAIFELAWKWYYLRKSMEVVLKERCNPRERPFRIAREYLRRISSPSGLDKLLEESAGIMCVKIKKRKNKQSGSPPVSADDKP